MFLNDCLFLLYNNFKSIWHLSGFFNSLISWRSRPQQRAQTWYPSKRPFSWNYIAAINSYETQANLVSGEHELHLRCRVSQLELAMESEPWRHSQLFACPSPARAKHSDLPTGVKDDRFFNGLFSLFTFLNDCYNSSQPFREIPLGSCLPSRFKKVFWFRLNVI